MSLLVATSSTGAWQKESLNETDARRHGAAFGTMAVALMSASLSGQDASVGNRMDGKRLFDRETFGGNGRTCLTCHSRETGTVSPEDASRRLAENPNDPLFVHDGSDDGAGNGTRRMLADATVLIQVPLAETSALPTTLSPAASLSGAAFRRR